MDYIEKNKLNIILLICLILSIIYKSYSLHKDFVFCKLISRVNCIADVSDYITSLSILIIITIFLFFLTRKIEYEKSNKWDITYKGVAVFLILFFLVLSLGGIYRIYKPTYVARGIDERVHVGIVDSLSNDVGMFEGRNPGSISQYPKAYHYLMADWYNLISINNDIHIVKFLKTSHYFFTLIIILSLFVFGKRFGGSNKGGLVAVVCFFSFSYLKYRYYNINPINFAFIIVPLILYLWIRNIEGKSKKNDHIIMIILLIGLFFIHYLYFFSIIIPFILYNIIFKKEDYKFKYLILITVFLICILLAKDVIYKNISNFFSSDLASEDIVFQIDRRLGFEVFFPIGILSVFSYSGLLLLFKNKKKIFNLCALLIISGILFNFNIPILLFLHNIFGDVRILSFIIYSADLISVLPNRMVIMSLQIGFLLPAIYSIIYILNKKLSFFKIVLFLMFISLILMAPMSQVHKYVRYQSVINNRYDNIELYEWSINNIEPAASVLSNSKITQVISLIIDRKDAIYNKLEKYNTTKSLHDAVFESDIDHIIDHVKYYEPDYLMIEEEENIIENISIKMKHDCIYEMFHNKEGLVYKINNECIKSWVYDLGGGSSPANISAYENGQSSPLKTINITMDVRNDFYGLGIWPFDKSK